MQHRYCHYLLLLIIFAAIIVASCSSSKKLQNRDLNHLQLSVEEPASENDVYTVHISGFDNSTDNELNAAFNRLSRHDRDDIYSIRRSGPEEAPELKVAVKNRPESLNRVLWLLGKDHYRNHSVNHSTDRQSGDWVIISSMPELIGGSEKLQDNLRYPDEMEGSGVEGQVSLQFIVNEYGEVENPEVIESLHPAADQEALRVISLAEYRPAMRDGLPVRVQMELTLLFGK